MNNGVFYVYMNYAPVPHTVFPAPLLPVLANQFSKVIFRKLKEVYPEMIILTMENLLVQ